MIFKFLMHVLVIIPVNEILSHYNTVTITLSHNYFLYSILPLIVIINANVQ